MFCLVRDELVANAKAHTGSAVGNRLVGDGEFAKVVSDHIALNFDDVEHSTVVNSHNRADHVRHLRVNKNKEKR